MPLPGSFLSQLQQDLDDPQRLEAFNIKHEEERNRRGQDIKEMQREEQWARFQRDKDILGAFSVLEPQSAVPQDNRDIANLQILARKLFPQHEKEVLQEWLSFKNHALIGACI